MELCIFVEPQQGATYRQQLEVARATEKAGLTGFFRSDHFLSMGVPDGSPGPTDAWTTLAGIARESSRIRLGTLMTAATFRQPGILAVIVAEVDDMSEGRVELGIGTAWYENEHAALGIGFPSLGERFDRLEEQLQILTGLWTSEGAFNFEGRYYKLTDNPAVPKPVQRPRPPLIIGGFGPRRTPTLAAQYADEFNMFSPTVEQFEKRTATAYEACEQNGRDPASLRLSIVQTLCCGRNPEEIEKRAKAIPAQLRTCKTPTRWGRRRSSSNHSLLGQGAGSGAFIYSCLTCKIWSKSSLSAPR